MKYAAQLWKEFHQASNSGNKELARQLLQALKGYSGNPPPPRGGCVKCRKRLY